MRQESKFVSQWRIKDWFSDLDDKALGKLKVYHRELLKFNGKINLIATSTERNADQVHFADAIMGTQQIFKHTDEMELFDIGSGNGIPGIVMAVLEPDRSFYLLDSDARKVEFLKHIIATLGLDNCNAKHSRAEDLRAGRVKCAVSRGVGSISKTLLFMYKIMAPNAPYYHFKSRRWMKEVAEIPTQVGAKWESNLVATYDLPANGAHLGIVVTRKRAE